MKFFNPLDGFWYADTLAEMPQTTRPASVKVFERNAAGQFPVLTLAESGAWELESTWDGELTSSIKNVRDSILQNSGDSSGSWEKVFEQEFKFDSSWSQPLDTGVVIEDATEYEVILSALAGTTSASAGANAFLLPKLKKGDGTIISGLVTLSAYAEGFLSAIFGFRGQIHPFDTDNAKKVVTVHPKIAGTYGIIIVSNTPNAQVDAASVGTLSPQIGLSGIRNIINSDDNFTICVAQPNAAQAGTSANIRYILKVYAKKG